MKSVKISKNMLRLDPQEFLVKLGAVDLKNKRTFPSSVYLAKQDYALLAKNLKKLLKKDYPYISTKKLEYSVGMELLDKGPNERLADAIKPGYAIVDFDEIEREKNANNGA